MHPEVSKYLDTLRGHPPARDLEAWRVRYAPLIERIIVKEGERRDVVVSVVVVVYRFHAGVERALERIVAERDGSRHEVELIVVNNTAQDERATTVFSRLADVHVVMRGNVGASPGRNVGAMQARGELLCFLDDDGVIEPGYIERGVAHFRADSNLAGLRTRIVADQHPYFTTLATHYDRGEQTIADYLITEGSMMVRRELFLGAGGFHDELFGHEGIELTFRIFAQREGWEVRYVPDMVMRHDYMDSWQKFVRKCMRYERADQGVPTRSEELEAFMSAFFSRRFPRARLSPDRYVARHLLRGMRYVLQRIR